MKEKINPYTRKPWTKVVPDENWAKAGMFKYISGVSDVVPVSYKCKKCGVRFQTSPPSYHLLGNMDSLFDVCPDCEEAKR